MKRRKTKGKWGGFRGEISGRAVESLIFTEKNKRKTFMDIVFKFPKTPIRPHIKNTAGGSRKQIFFIFDIVKVLGCKRRVITFDSDDMRARFTQKGNQVRLK